jgi:sRNA-binding protein
MTMSDLAINSLASPQPTTSAEKRRRALERIIATLAQLFPATFVAERWQRHKPLKLGIHLDLVECGVLLHRECH